MKEPGKSGSLWRLHYSVRLPSLACDFFRLTGTQGRGTGESLQQFPIREGDYLLADRGYSTAAGIGYVAEAGGRVTVRVNTSSLPLQTSGARPFRFAEKGLDAAKSGRHRILGRPGHRPPGSSGGGSHVRTAQDRGSD